MGDAVGEWEKKNPLRAWLDSGKGDGLDVTINTGMPQKRQEELMQGLALPTDPELKALGDLLGDPNLAEAWKEWRMSNPSVQTGSI